MKFPAILGISLLLAFGFAGCVTLPPRDESMLQEHHVSGAVIDKLRHGERIELADIVELSKRAVPEPFILGYLRSTYAVYTLASSDVMELAQAGVSKPVIDYLLATPSMYAPQNYPYNYYYPGFYGPYYDYPPPLVVGDPYFHHH